MGAPGDRCRPGMNAGRPGVRPTRYHRRETCETVVGWTQL